MPNIIKTRELGNSNNDIIHHETSADIVKFDPTRNNELYDTNVQSVIETLNRKVEDRVTTGTFNSTVDTITDIIASVKKDVSNRVTKSTFEETVGEINEHIVEVNQLATAKASTNTYTSKIIAKNFTQSDNMYIQTIPVDGILETDNPIIGLLEVDSLYEALDHQEAWGNISRIICKNGSITVFCYEDVPQVDIDVQIKVIR